MWVPSILRPDYTWPCPMRAVLSTTTPKVPSMPGKVRLRLQGLVHAGLYHVSKWYCALFGIPVDYQVMQLPFGLVMKRNGRCNLEEAAAMQMARAGGLPVPLVLSCGEHPYYKDGPFSILMTRLPGDEMPAMPLPFEPDAEGPWLGELKACYQAMRHWQPPDSQRISSVLGTAITSMRVPEHKMGPFANSTELYDYLIWRGHCSDFKSEQQIEDTLQKANQLRSMPHRLTFTHGDLKAHNILIDEHENLTGLIDWESAGWCPEYWEATTVGRVSGSTWWGHVVEWLSDGMYQDELACDKAVNRLTVDSYCSW